MSKKFSNNGAFAACSESGGQDGISRLEYFAAQAMSGWIQGDAFTDMKAAASYCFDVAELMCAEAEKRRKP